MQKKNILCITTWWTIVSEKSEKWLVQWKSIDVFKDSVRCKIEALLNVDFVNLYNIDSSDTRWENFELIAKKIKQLHHKYDWFVIAHWTDTMAYTASVLSYMLKWLDKPIILTGSMISIEEEWTDAIDNLVNTFNASVNSLLHWVYICFWGRLIYWNKAVKLDTSSFTTFNSPNFKDIWIFQDNNLVLDNSLVNRINWKLEETSNKVDIDVSIEKQVYLLKLFPWINYDIFDFLMTSWIKWLVIEWFWDWNVPSDELFRSKVEMCIKWWMKIFLKSQCISWNSKSEYAWWKALIDLGCFNSVNLTSEAALWKMMWAISKSWWNEIILKQLLSQDVNWDSLTNN